MTLASRRYSTTTSSRDVTEPLDFTALSYLRTPTGDALPDASAGSTGLSVESWRSLRAEEIAAALMTLADELAAEALQGGQLAAGLSLASTVLHDRASELLDAGESPVG